MLGSQLIELHIGAVPALADPAFRQSGGDGAARLLQVGAVVKAAASQIRGKFDKIILKLLLVNGLHHLDIKGGKARRGVSATKRCNVSAKTVARMCFFAVMLLSISP